MHQWFWHYTDSQGAEHGPVTADAVRTAIDEGRIGPSSQFWHEGLPGWIDLATAATDLGVAAGTAPPPDPYAAPRANVGAAENSFVAGNDVVPAGFARRFVAWALDQLILMVVLFGMAMVLGVGMAASGQADTEPGMAFVVLFYVGWFVALALYYGVQESSTHQATLGKRALGIKVADQDGRRLSFAHALGRWVAAAVSYLTFYIGFLMAAFTARKTALHDMLSSTQVVDRWAYTDTPQRQQRELSGCLVAIVIGLLVLPLVGVALMVAVAVAQYDEYKGRTGAAPAPVQAPAVVRASAIPRYVDLSG